MSRFQCSGLIAVGADFEKCALEPSEIVANQPFCGEHAVEARFLVLHRALQAIVRDPVSNVLLTASRALRDAGMDERERLNCVIRKDANMGGDAQAAYQRVIAHHRENLRGASAKPSIPAAVDAPEKNNAGRVFDDTSAGGDESASARTKTSPAGDEVIPNRQNDPLDKPVSVATQPAADASPGEPDKTGADPQPNPVIVTPPPAPMQPPALASKPARPIQVTKPGAQVKPAPPPRPAPPNVDLPAPGDMPLVLALWTPARNEIIRRDWPLGISSDVIFDACRRLPGALIKDVGRIAIQAAALGVKRPPKEGNSALPMWSERRKSLLAEDFPAGKTLEAIKRGLESMPGPRVSNAQIIEQAKAMSLSRPAWFLKTGASAAQPDVGSKSAPKVDEQPKPRGCSFALNDFPPYRFCNAPVANNKLYCAKHQVEMKQRERSQSATSGPPAPSGDGKKRTRALRDYGAYSRFTHVKPSANESAATLPRMHPAVLEARTLFPSRVRPPNHSDKKRLLVSGYSSPKTGSIVTKGPWAGMPIYTLTLEERATCPRSCLQWRNCMGNNMHFPLRTSPSDALVPALRRELKQLAAEYPGGFVVRLHILGDFFSVDYARFWVSMLDECQQLHVFGYSAQPQYNAIAAVLHEGNENHPDRWAIRFSGADTVPPYMATTVIWRQPEKAVVPEGIVCPAQTERTACCGTCALCWNPAAAEKRIVFIGHGGHAKDEPKEAWEQRPMDIAA